jgi:hypothetical protein
MSDGHEEQQTKSTDITLVEGQIIYQQSAHRTHQKNGKKIFNQNFEDFPRKCWVEYFEMC